MEKGAKRIKQRERICVSKNKNERPIEEDNIKGRLIQVKKKWQLKNKRIYTSQRENRVLSSIENKLIGNR